MSERIPVNEAAKILGMNPQGVPPTGKKTNYEYHAYRSKLDKVLGKV